MVKGVEQRMGEDTMAAIALQCRGIVGCGGEKGLASCPRHPIEL
jgi:hypothetical protein